MSVALPDLRIVYMPIPKAACTSVKAALASIDPEAPITAEEIAADPYCVHAHYQTTRFRPHRWEPYSDGTWWRFAVVRDPLKRLLGVYSNRVEELKELYHSPKMREQTALPMDPDPDFFFQNLLAYMELSSTIKHHALPSHLFIGPLPLRFDTVYKTENLGQLGADLSARAGREVRVPRFNSTEHPLKLSDLAPATMDALRERLSDEYIHLQDYYKNPLA